MKIIISAFVLVALFTALRAFVRWILQTPEHRRDWAASHGAAAEGGYEHPASMADLSMDSAPTQKHISGVGWTPDAPPKTLSGVPTGLVARLAKDHIVGEVRQLANRQERKRGFYVSAPGQRPQVTVKAFRVHQRLPDGQERVFAVEMRGLFFSGDIQNGDLVGFPTERVRAGRTTDLRELRNLSGGDVLIRAEA